MSKIPVAIFGRVSLDSMDFQRQINDLQKIADKLNEEGIPTKRSKSEKGYLTLYGKKQEQFFWRDATIHRILTNSLYAGKRNFKGNILNDSNN